MWKSISDFTSTNQRGETSFSHVQKSFRPITNHGLSESCFRGLFRGHRGKLCRAALTRQYFRCTRVVRNSNLSRARMFLGMAEQSRTFVSPDKPIDKFIEDQKNKNTLSKTRRDESLWLSFSTPKMKAGACFSKVPKTFRALKAIRKTPTCLFCKARLKNNCEVSCLETPLFRRYKENYVTGKAPEKFRDFRDMGSRRIEEIPPKELNEYISEFIFKRAVPYLIKNWNVCYPLHQLWFLIGDIFTCRF